MAEQKLKITCILLLPKANATFVQTFLKSIEKAEGKNKNSLKKSDSIPGNNLNVNT